VTSFGFHASHEQVPPSALLASVEAAEQAGFSLAMCSDHFAPWSVRQGQSGYAWSWLGAALARTSLPIGVVTAPGQRYHPAITAQAAATLEEMFPGRFWMALGSGENSNEHITGTGWPLKAVRQQRLEECADVINRLLEGETVSHDGLVRVENAKLWSLPTSRPAVAAAAVSPETARAVASWADGLITVSQPPESLRRVIDAYRGSGGSGPLMLQVHLSWATTEEEAAALAHDQWRSNVFPPPVCWDLAAPEHFDLVSEHVTVEQVKDAILVSSDLERHAQNLHDLAGLGFDRVYLHHVGQDQASFINAFGDKVLPQLRGQ
jgi:probable non-F420 flavinoid oxidoreductase